MIYRQGDVGLTAQGSVDSLEEDVESLNQTVLEYMEKLLIDREKTIEVKDAYARTRAQVTTDVTSAVHSKIGQHAEVFLANIARTSTRDQRKNKLNCVVVCERRDIFVARSFQLRVFLAWSRRR